jgi:hypothetical protein
MINLEAITKDPVLLNRDAKVCALVGKLREKLVQEPKPEQLTLEDWERPELFGQLMTQVDADKSFISWSAILAMVDLCDLLPPLYSQLRCSCCSRSFSGGTVRIIYRAPTASNGGQVVCFQEVTTREQQAAK